MCQKHQVRLADWLTPDRINIDIDARDKRDLLAKLAAQASANVEIDHDHVVKRLQARERLGSTAIGRGIAIPHAVDLTGVAIPHLQTNGLSGPYLSLSRLNKPIDFDATDGCPVDIVFLMLVPERERMSALPILSAAARVLRSGHFLEIFRNASSPQQAYAALVDEELFPQSGAGQMG